MNRLITILFLGMTAIIMQAKTDKEQLTNEARAEGKLACTMPCKEKEDESQIEALYRVMYEAMMAKDTVTLNRIHADVFVLIHMTGMHQSKLHLHALRNIEKDNDHSSICRFYAFRRVSF